MGLFVKHIEESAKEESDAPATTTGDVAMHSVPKKKEENKDTDAE